MDFFRLFEKLIPSYLKENTAADTEENNNNTRDPSMNLCQGKKMQREGNVSVNSDEYIPTNSDSSIDNVEEFAIGKTPHDIENVSPIAMTTNADIDLEPIANEKCLIENAKIFNNASDTSFGISNDEYRGGHSDLDSNANILETAGNATVNSNEWTTNLDSSVDNIEEFGVNKIFHNIENVSPFELTTNEDIDPIEPMENEKRLIENARIFNNASETSLSISEDQYRGIYSDLDNFANILETEGRATVNSNECISTNRDPSLDNIEEIVVSKTLHNLENVSPIEMNTNDDIEPMENEKSLIENARIFNNASETSLGINEDIDSNANIIKTEENAAVNSNEYFLPEIDSIGNIEEFCVTKTYHNLENVTPNKITTNDITHQEQIENEISFIEGIILNNATGASLVANNIIEDQTVLNKNKNDLEEIKIRHDTEVYTQTSLHTNMDTNTTYNNVLNDETMNFDKIEAALDIKNKHVFTAEIGTDFINLDEFKDIFDETDAVYEDLVGTVYENNTNAANYKDETYTDINNDINLNLNGNIETITIDSSTEDEMSQKLDIRDTISINDSDETDDGYNSSDFEFISETEAKMAGIVINHGIEKHQKLSQASSEPIIFCFDEENHQGNEEFDPGEGPSRQNRPRNEFEDRSYRDNHHIPLGDDYLGLFQGIYNPLMPVSDILFLENKSVRASAMNMQYDGMGFDKQLALAMRRHQPDSSEDEFEDDAKETAKKILNMYPGDNRKRRRRYL